MLLLPRDFLEALNSHPCSPVVAPGTQSPRMGLLWWPPELSDVGAVVFLGD